MQLDPRTSQILFILLQAKHPISVDEIATQLSISRRTLYRELKNMTPVLEEWHLTMESIAGQGVILTGSDADRDGLLAQIRQSDAFDPRNRKARQTLLAALLLRQTSPNKIFSFASALQVSESTISNDLQDLEPWFAQYHLEIHKRPGFGIYPEGEEKDFRLACLRLAQDCQESDFASRIRQHRGSDVFHLLDEEQFYQLYHIFQQIRQKLPFRITEGSQILLLTYLTIACHRMAAGHWLEGSQENWQGDTALRQDPTLSSLLQRIEDAFSLSITQAEAQAIHIYLKGAKPRYLDKHTDFLQDDAELTSLIGEMLDCFEPGVRLYLEHDPEFFQALAAHLRPALVRMEHNIQVDNPFLHEVQQTYPDLYQKAVYAGQVIHKRLGYEVPDSEIGLLAVHFGGALFRYDQTHKPRRLVRIAVVCSSGIGISRLLTAQLQNAFAGKVKLFTYGEAFEDIHAAPVDFIVTTFPLDLSEKKVLQVHPILTDADMAQIHQYISFYALQPEEPDSREDVQHLTDSIHHLSTISRDAGILLHRFAVHQVPSDTDFHRLTRFFSQQFGQTPPDQEQIERDILKREQLFTQVIPQYRLAFLHARTPGAREPGFQIAYPAGPIFTDPYLQSCTVAIGMVVPVEAERSEVIGAVSDMLFSQDELLDAILQRREDEIPRIFQKLMKEYLKSHIQTIFE